MKILCLQNAEIDKQKWDSCLNDCSYGLLYARSFYLDIMSPGWQALVFDDYQFIMPLTCKKKFGISYLYQPAFTQQLGIFGTEVPGNDIIKAFLHRASAFFKFAEINLNYKNNIDDFSKRKTNLILSLGSSFDEIKNNFKRDFVKIYKTSPGKWLLARRLEYGMHLLRTQGKSVSDSAFESGFESPSHFSRSFRERFGISPAGVRQQVLS